MSAPVITYAPRPDATPEAETSALAAVYMIVLTRKKAAPESRRDDGTKIKEDSANEHRST